MGIDETLAVKVWGAHVGNASRRSYRQDPLDSQSPPTTHLLENMIRAGPLPVERYSVKTAFDGLWLDYHAACVAPESLVAFPDTTGAYKVGELRILRLRKEAEQQLGDKFDLRAFHDALLSGGAMPIDMLEKRTREWIASQW